jgi:hypothetical protein
VRDRFTELQKAQILERDQHRCAYCGDVAYEVDHIFPKSKGGEATLDNGVAACLRCNRKKKDKLDLMLLTRGFFVVLGGNDGNTNGYENSKRHPGISAKGWIKPTAIRNQSRRRLGKIAELLNCQVSQLYRNQNILTLLS